MPRAETIATVRRDRDLVAQHAVVEVEHLQSAGFLRLAAGGIVAAGDQDDLAVVRRGANLVREDPRINRPRLRDLVARRRIGVDAIHADRTWIVERDQHELRGHVGRHVDRSRRQADRCAMRTQRASRRIDRQCGHVVRVSGRPHARRAVAGGDIKEPPRGMRPGILHVRRQADRVTARQRRGSHIHIVMRQLRPDIGIQRNLVRHVHPPAAGPRPSHAARAWPVRQWREIITRRTRFDALWCLHVPPRKQAHDELEALRPGVLGVRMLTAAT